jgi:hypothetical protein
MTYEIKIRRQTELKLWELLPIEAETLTDNQVDLHQTLAQLRQDIPGIAEFRCNRRGSLQGYYFPGNIATRPKTMNFHRKAILQGVTLHLGDLMVDTNGKTWTIGLISDQVIRLDPIGLHHIKQRQTFTLGQLTHLIATQSFKKGN